jgi:D-alanyl-D-alanine carboxypeptidase
MRLAGRHAIEMSALRTFHYFLCSSFGLLLFVGAALAEDVEVSSRETIDECLAVENCVDQYLWSLYERTPKIDSVRVFEKRRVRIKRKGRTRIVTRTTIKLEDYTWKDPAAAQKVGMSLSEYVIGGMDHNFKLTLYHALRALDDAGLAPGITSAFRDNYRQSIATGYKAHDDCSYHGGSRHGGYGHGLAVDIVSVKGMSRAERSASSEELWKWIDTHGKQFGIGRPYLDRDPPHVAPLDGKEYVNHRGRAHVQYAASRAKKRHLLSRPSNGVTKHAAMARFSKARGNS